MKPERHFVDTNLFLRYLTNDIPEQAEAVERLFRRAATGDCVLVVSSLVIAEIIWVLESFYRLPRPEIKDKVLAILNTPGLEIPDGDMVLQAITWYAEQNVDFIDAYNGAWMLSQKINLIYTFDHAHFARLGGITPVLP